MKDKHVYLIRVVWEVDFVEDLCRLVLNRLYFNLMWWIFSLTVSQCLLKPLN